jgi:cytochrome c-type biogenesis protein
MFLTSSSGFGNTDAPLAFALITGVLTAFNPCGFAMLPAYVSYFVGQSGEDKTSVLTKRLARASTTGFVVTLGFMTVFGILGLIATGFYSTIDDYVPYVSMVVGVVLAILGVLMLRGFEPKLSFLKVKKSRSGSGLTSMYVYGLSYAIVSLSCGFGGFASAVVASGREKSFASKMSVYIAFAAGMGLVLIVLSFAVAFAQQAFVRGMRQVLPYVNRVSGGLLVASGLYVAYYGYYEWKTIIRGESAREGPVGLVQDWSTSFKTWVSGIPVNVLVIALVGVAGVAAVSLVLTKGAKKSALSDAVGFTLVPDAGAAVSAVPTNPQRDPSGAQSGFQSSVRSDLDSRNGFDDETTQAHEQPVGKLSATKVASQKP